MPLVTRLRGIDRAAGRGEHHRHAHHRPRHPPRRRAHRRRRAPRRPRATTRRARRFNLLVDQRPAAVAFPSDARDVADAVALARAPRAARRAAGHGPQPGAARATWTICSSSTSAACRRSASIRAPAACASAPGVKWDRVAPRLSAHGLAGLHGSSPDVGIAGYSLGGGMGWLARKHGLQTNAVTALELVTADGELRRVDAEHEPDLFWALRGGGGNFGVVTAIEFGVVEVDELYAGAYFFPFERADEVLHTWNACGTSLPDELMSWASLLHFPPIPDVPALRPRALVRGRDGRVPRRARAEGASLLRAAAPARPGARHVRQRAAGRARRPRHGPARPGAVPEHLGAARRAAARRRSTPCWPRRARSPGVARPSRCCSCARWAARWPAPRRAPARAPRCRATSACSRSASLFDEPMARGRPRRPRRRRRRPAPYRAGYYPNFVEEPADASAFFDPATWARLRRSRRPTTRPTSSWATTTSRRRDGQYGRTGAPSRVRRECSSAELAGRGSRGYHRRPGLPRTRGRPGGSGGGGIRTTVR